MPTGDKLFRGFLVVIFVAMSVEMVLLIRENRKLRAQIAAPTGGPAGVVTDLRPALREGETVTSLELLALDGGFTQVAYDDAASDTLLMVFSPDCPACQANMDNWKRLATEERRFYYISTAETEATRRYAEAYGLSGPVLVGDVAALAPYKITHTPTTIVVGPGGVVKKVWIGVLPDDASSQI